jgi:hypothetical protein
VYWRTVVSYSPEDRGHEVGGAGSMAHVLVMIAKDPISSTAFQSFNSDLIVPESAITLASKLGCV